MAPADDTLASLGQPEFGRLWGAARRRLERNGVRITTSPLTLDDLTSEEVTAICGLLARRRPAGNRIRVSLAELDQVLRASNAQLGLVETIESISGPVVDRVAQSAANRRQQTVLWQAAASHPAVRRDDVRAWLDSIRQRGRLTRLSADDPAALLDATLDGVDWLLAQGDAGLAIPLPLAAVAAVQFGDGHALDPDTPLGALLEDAVLALSGLTDVRAAWRRFGVQLDSVSSSALTYMLPGTPNSLASAASSAAQPLRVTHRMIEHGFGLEVRPGDIVWVCENPSIVTLAADQLGDACRPLVCLEGMPSAVTSHLLAAVREAGGELRVHSDFDLGGVAITSHVSARFGAVPWRMGSVDYLDALDGPTSALRRTIGATPWDLGLSAAMNQHGRAVHEEALFSRLLADLRR